MKKSSRRCGAVEKHWSVNKINHWSVQVVEREEGRDRGRGRRDEKCGRGRMGDGSGGMGDGGGGMGDGRGGMGEHLR